MTRQLPIDLSTNITLDGSGNGTARIGPQLPREVWNLDTASITIPAGGFPICKVYVGPQPTDAYIVDTSYLGAGDSTGRVSGRPLRNGEFVWAVWTAAVANSLATLRVLGSKTVP